MELAEIINLISLAGGSSIITILATKITSLKKEKQELASGAQDIANKQNDFLQDINEKLNETITKLQEVACYTPNCNTRTNGIGRMQIGTTAKGTNRNKK